MEFSPSLIWFLVGVAFLISELLAPGLILIFFTAGCWIAAISAWLSDISLTIQIVIFIISSLVLLVTLRKYCLKTFKGNILENNLDDDFENSKIGKSAIVTQPIAPGMPGEIKLAGSFWRAMAETQIDTGQSVIIVDHEPGDSLTYKVKLP